MTYPLEDDALARAIGDALAARGARVAVAETTAGGLISARLLSVAGASRWFERGVVAYTGGPKRDISERADVMQREHGTVSREFVVDMVESLRARAGVEFAVAESGIAGPQGSRRSPKPVGSVVIAVASPAETRVEEHVFPGARAEVMVRIAERSLQLLREALAAEA